MMPLRKLLKTLGAYKKLIVLFLTPVIASPLLILLGYPSEMQITTNATAVSIQGPPARCAYCVAIMASYWVFEVLPIAVTALLPTVLFPLLHVLTSEQVCLNYLTDTNFLFVGGLMVALAVERSNLHQRIGLKVLTVVGSQIHWLMLGFIGVTAFLSMWINNTAATAMMLPIVQSVIKELFKERKLGRTLSAASRQGEQSTSGEAYALTDRQIEQLKELNAGAVGSSSTKRHKVGPMLESQPVPEPDIISTLSSDSEEELDMNTLHPEDHNIAKALLLSIAYAALVGGTATVTGTAPNIVAVGQVNDMLYPGSATGLSYATWLQFAIVPALTQVVVLWIFLIIYFLGFRHCLSIYKLRAQSEEDQAVSRLIQARYNRLPKFTFAEANVLVCFLVLLILWIIRDQTFGRVINPKNSDGNSVKYFTDATSAMIISILLFILPNKRPDLYCSKRRMRDGAQPRIFPNLRGG